MTLIVKTQIFNNVFNTVSGRHEARQQLCRRIWLMNKIKNYEIFDKA